MYAPAQDDEITTLRRYLEQQLDALRASVHGLTQEQSRDTPCRSALSIAGLLKHTAYGMRGATARLRGEPVPDVRAAFSEYLGSFAAAEGETTTSIVEAFDAARTAYLAAVAAADPDAEAMEPPAPWHGRFEAEPIRVRYYLVHQVEEMARHAGHADIVREQLDGVSVPSLVLTLEGARANDFFTPYDAPPGTIDLLADGR